MLLIVGTIRLPPDRISDARPFMKRMVEATRAELGCHDYCYAEDVLDPGLVHVKELWSDRDALDRHFSSDHIREWRASWPDLGIGSRQLVLYEVDAPQQI